MAIDHLKPLNQIKNTNVFQIIKYSQKKILHTQQNQTNLPRENVMGMDI